MKNSELINIIISATEALGTLIVAILAIFAQTIKTWFYKSNLTFEIGSESPFIKENVIIEEFSTEIKKSISINLKIINNGNISALNTQLYTEKIFRFRAENNTYHLLEEFIPVNFIWNNESDTKSLPPLMSHYIEIAKIQPQVYFSNDRRTKDEDRNSKDSLFLSVNKTSNSGEQYFLGKGTWILPIKAFAKNMKIEKEIFVQIFWNGNDINHKSQTNFFVRLLSKNDLPKDIISEI